METTADLWYYCQANLFTCRGQHERKQATGVCQETITTKPPFCNLGHQSSLINLGEPILNKQKTTSPEKPSRIINLCKT